MKAVKKQAAGFYLTILTIILAGLGMIFYLINCRTDYFSKLGMNGGLVLSGAAAIVLLLLWLKMAQLPVQKNYFDILPVLSSVLLMIMFTIFLSVRISGAASILSFERNARTMADLSSALAGIGCCLLALLVGLVAAFFDVVKYEA